MASSLAYWIGSVVGSGLFQIAHVLKNVGFRMQESQSPRVSGSAPASLSRGHVCERFREPLQLAEHFDFSYALERNGLFGEKG
jgi:hypothetical protein